jgi:hypothetical protein
MGKVPIMEIQSVLKWQWRCCDPCVCISRGCCGGQGFAESALSSIPPVANAKPRSRDEENRKQLVDSITSENGEGVVALWSESLIVSWIANDTSLVLVERDWAMAFPKAPSLVSSGSLRVRLFVVW